MMMIDTPFFSILVVSYNAENTIRKTIESILNQDCNDYEIIVKDACSKDSTIENIPDASCLQIVVTNDEGIYDGMNEAVTYASGRYCIFMNCGDLFASKNVLKLAKTSLQIEEPLFAYGDYSRNGVKHRQPSVLNEFYLYRTPLCHQTIFFETQSLKKKYFYNTQYEILADYDVELSMFFDGVKTKHLDVVICDYVGGGISESRNGIKKKRNERKMILAAHYSKKLRLKFEFIYCLTLPRLRGWLISDQAPKWVRSGYQSIVNRVNK